MLLPLNEEEKKRQYVKIMHGVPDAIFVLSARVRRAQKKEQGYTTTAYSDSDPHGILGGKARIFAAVEVASHFSSTKIVTTTQGKDLSGNLVIDANIMAEELKQFGISEERIIRETKSIDTLTELQEAVKLIAAKNFSFTIILTNDYHIPRCIKMYECLEALSNPQDELLKRSLEKINKEKAEVIFVAAENILPFRSSHYSYLISQVHRTSEYAKRLQSERDGISAISGGAYKSKGETWKIKNQRFGDTTKK